jgi:AraC family transcriptional regulator
MSTFYIQPIILISKTMMQPRIQTLSEKKLVGKKQRMSFSNHQPAALWRSFMPELSQIKNVAGPELYSLEVYDADFFKPYHPDKEFEKWAAVEVSDFDSVPEQMETLTVPTGVYAVFTFKGLQNQVAAMYNSIFTEWLPGSDYALDNRPHFALMGEKYKKDDPDSEEEIWIPIHPKSR